MKRRLVDWLLFFEVHVLGLYESRTGVVSTPTLFLDYLGKMVSKIVAGEGCDASQMRGSVG
jgi:hypothetical protein